jgi:hypothetical protein
VTAPYGRSDWVRIAEEIELNYQNFDSFVVLHGTDTMAYSSSALSFLLEDLGKTVVSLEGGVINQSAQPTLHIDHHWRSDSAIPAP